MNKKRQRKEEKAARRLICKKKASAIRKTQEPLMPIGNNVYDILLDFGYTVQDLREAVYPNDLVSKYFDRYWNTLVQETPGLEKTADDRVASLKEMVVNDCSKSSMKYTNRQQKTRTSFLSNSASSPNSTRTKAALTMREPLATASGTCVPVLCALSSYMSTASHCTPMDGGDYACGLVEITAAKVLSGPDRGGSSFSYQRRDPSADAFDAHVAQRNAPSVALVHVPAQPRDRKRADRKDDQVPSHGGRDRIDCEHRVEEE